ncbi:MAG: glycosyltransferase family 25 protein [Burkholderiales bacterium]|jgi:glycosyl transferase family 25|nr:glycosyltransferase family 25 protein [Burkholderiales bacterium]
MSDFPCFVVNLEKDKERRIAVEKELHRLNIPHIIFPAVYGADLSDDELLKVYDQEKARLKKREVALSEIGCALSHYYIYQAMVNQNLPYALILEDDAVLADETPILLNELSRALDPNAPTVVLLSFARRYLARPALPLTSTHTLFNVYGHAVGTYAYCLTQRAAQHLMKVIYPVSRPNDRWGEFADEKVIDLKTIVPYCASHNEAFVSNIIDERDAVNRLSGQSFRREKRYRQWSRLFWSLFLPVKKQQKTW